MNKKSFRKRVSEGKGDSKFFYFQEFSDFFRHEGFLLRSFRPCCRLLSFLSIIILPSIGWACFLKTIFIHSDRSRCKYSFKTIGIIFFADDFSAFLFSIKCSVYISELCLPL